VYTARETANRVRRPKTLSRIAEAQAREAESRNGGDVAGAPVWQRNATRQGDLDDLNHVRGYGYLFIFFSFLFSSGNKDTHFLL